MNKIDEQWRIVKGYENYAVSDKGRVKSLNYRHTGREQVMKPAKDDEGYLYVRLWKNGVRKKYLVHRLVALAFIPNPCPEKYNIINHKDDIPNDHTNNTVENLEWCDYDYNSNYGTCQERKAKAKSKTVYQYTTTTHELVKEWQSATEVERQTGWYQSAISACCNNRFNREGNNVYKGFIWSYEKLHR